MSMQNLSNVAYRSRNVLILVFNLMVLCFISNAQNATAPRRDQQRPAVNPAIAEFEPALAIRGSACITCHAKIHSSYITDFGHGDTYFFGSRGGATKGLGSFDGSIYGDFYGGEPNKTGWLTAQIDKPVVVPEAPFDFKASATGSKVAAQSDYQKPLEAGSLAKYLKALEGQKPNPATVIEKKLVFIGAPTAATLQEGFNIAPGSATKLKYIKTAGDSPDMEGIGLSPGKDFYTNTREVVCDGDLFVGGTVFLNSLTLSTKSGCRIYATGPIFLQNGISYRNLSASADETNLQLVSAQAILAGVGDKSCDAAKDSPLSRRLVSGYAVSTFMTRDAHRNSLSPQAIGQSIYDQGKLIPSLEDASCHSDTVSYSRLLLNAPQIHSRYTGNFKGLIIAEVALFARGKLSLEYEFDPVFKKVSTLPVLKDSDYLQVK